MRLVTETGVLVGSICRNAPLHRESPWTFRAGDGAASVLWDWSASAFTLGLALLFFGVAVVHWDVGQRVPQSVVRVVGQLVALVVRKRVDGW